MGYWYDKTKFGPLIYLLSTNHIETEPRTPKSIPRTVPQLQACLSGREDQHMEAVREADILKSPNRIRRKGVYLLSPLFDDVSSPPRVSTKPSRFKVEDPVQGIAGNVRSHLQQTQLRADSVEKNLEEDVACVEQRWWREDSKMKAAATEAMAPIKPPPPVLVKPRSDTMSDTSDESVTPPNSSPHGTAAKRTVDERSPWRASIMTESVTPERQHRDKVSKRETSAAEQELVDSLTPVLKICEELKLREGSPASRRALSPSLVLVSDKMNVDDKSAFNKCTIKKDRFECPEDDTVIHVPVLEPTPPFDSEFSHSLTGSFRKGLSDSFKNVSEEME